MILIKQKISDQLEFLRNEIFKDLDENDESGKILFLYLYYSGSKLK